MKLHFSLRLLTALSLTGAVSGDRRCGAGDSGDRRDRFCHGAGPARAATQVGALAWSAALMHQYGCVRRCGAQIECMR